MIDAYQQANMMPDYVDWKIMTNILLGNGLFIATAITGMVFFIRQRPIGWYLLTGFSVYKTVAILLSIGISISLRLTEATNILFVMLFFTAGVMVLLLLPSLTRRFHVKRVTAIIIIASVAVAATVFTLIQFASLLFPNSHSV